LQFHSWLDARRLALPGEGDLTCDTVAGFHLAGQAELSHALIVEFMAELRSNTLDRLLAYVLRARTESPSAEGQELPPRIGGVVINLTGPAQARAVQATFPGVPECDWGFGVLQWTLREESAADTLADIAAGRTTRWILPWIPLMQDGAETAIIEQWKQVALTEPNAETRSWLGAFALVFARLAKRDDLWKQALRDWDMRNLQEVDYWQNEGRAEGQLEARQDDLVALLEKRFGPLPKELLQRIQALTDGARLKTDLRQLLDIHSLEDLQL
jgi:hypothetical protein